MNNFFDSIKTLLGNLNPFKEKTYYMYKDSDKVYDSPQVVNGIENRGGKIIPTYTEAPRPTQMPRPIPTMAPQIPNPPTMPAQVPQQGAGFHITVPGQNGPVNIPDEIAQILGNELDQYKLATQAAQVLVHPKQQTFTPQEVAKYGRENWNIGENPRFITKDTPDQKITTPQANGTFDMGLMRNNTGTFQLLQGSRKWNKILKDNGITDVSQLNDPTISVRYAKILGDWYENDLGLPRWLGWFAAPLELRTQTQ